jgi:hypothetical protein
MSNGLPSNLAVFLPCEVRPVIAGLSVGRDGIRRFVQAGAPRGTPA